MRNLKKIIKTLYVNINNVSLMKKTTFSKTNTFGEKSDIIFTSASLFLFPTSHLNV